MAPAGALAAAWLLGACTSTPLAPIPQPLPELVAWARAESRGGAFLGLVTRENDSGSLDELAFDPGLYVTRVVENSPAAAAGLRGGDVLIAVGERSVDDPGALAALLAAATPGPAELVVRRGEGVLRVPVALRPVAGPGEVEPELLYRFDPSRSRAGWLAGRGGVVLVASADEAPFPRAGVEVGSVVRALDGEPVASERELIRALQRREPGERVRVEYVDPSGDARRARVRLFDAPRRVTALKLPILLDYEAQPGGERASFELVDLFLISLFRYERQGAERRYSIFSLIRFATGVGELSG